MTDESFNRVAYLENEYDLWCVVACLTNDTGVRVESGDLIVERDGKTLTSQDGSIAYWRYLHPTDCEWLEIDEDGLYEREGLFAFMPMSPQLWANAQCHIAYDRDSARITQDTFLVSERAMRELAAANQVDKSVIGAIAHAPLWLIGGDRENGVIGSAEPISGFSALVEAMPEATQWTDQQRLDNHLHAEWGCNPDVDECLMSDTTGSDMEPGEIHVYAAGDPLGRVSVLGKDEQGNPHALGMVGNRDQALVLAQQWVSHQDTQSLNDETGDLDLSMDDHLSGVSMDMN